MPLVDTGFDVLSLANNHAYDYGRGALLEAAHRLDAQGIAPLGVRFAGESRPRHRVIERNGVRVALLAYSAFVFSDAPVTNAVQVQGMRRDIAAARAAADRVVVSFHWGVEYQSHANAKQRRLGRAAVDAGADLVIGHHPHVFQGVEIYRQRVIAYSLGNFLFDQPWAHTRRGLLLDWRVDELGEQRVRLYPVKIDKQPYRSRIPIGAAARELLRPVIELCAAFGTTTELEDDSLRIVLQPPGAALATATQCVESTAVSAAVP